MRDFLRRIISLAFVLGSCVAAAGPQGVLKTGKGSFLFINTRLNQGRPLTVWTYIPTKLAHASPVLFVLHGNSRNADEYRDQWADIAERNNALLLCPEFSGEDFPLDTQYNMGNMFIMSESDSILGPVAESDWTYSLIEPVFDLARKMTNNASAGYFIYGHSAGSQFVHRFLFFKPGARVIRAVCANAGWYTVPDFDTVFPYGLKGTGVTKDDLRTVFGKDVTIFLGDADTDTESPSLRKTPEAMAQGRHRFERGNNFYAKCRDTAGELRTKFNWKLAVAPGVAHSNTDMAPLAEKILFK